MKTKVRIKKLPKAQVGGEKNQYTPEHIYPEKVSSVGIDPNYVPYTGDNKSVAKSNYNGSSIVDYLGQQGRANDYNTRKKLAEKNGIVGYRGTASQNKMLLNTLRQSTNTKSLNNEAVFEDWKASDNPDVYNKQFEKKQSISKKTLNTDYNDWKSSNVHGVFSKEENIPRYQYRDTPFSYDPFNPFNSIEDWGRPANASSHEAVKNNQPHRKTKKVFDKEGFKEFANIFAVSPAAAFAYRTYLQYPKKFMKFGGVNTTNNIPTGKTKFNHIAADEQSLNDYIGSVDRNEANIEAERGESVMGDFNGDGQLEHMQIGGARHSAGGTALNVPKGAFIFSDTPKMRIGGEILEHFGKSVTNKKKFTPAQLAKQYDLNFYQEKAKNKDNDKFATDTAEIMYENNKKKLGKLAFVQEAMKGFPTGIPGVSQQIEQEGQQEPPMARYGGGFNYLPKAQIGVNDPTNNLFEPEMVKAFGKNLLNGVKLQLSPMANNLNKMLKVPTMQHSRKNGDYGTQDWDHQEFKKRHNWYFKNHNNFNFGKQSDVTNFQNSYNNEYEKKWQTKYFNGTKHLMVDGKFGEGTYNAPGLNYQPQVIPKLIIPGKTIVQEEIKKKPDELHTGDYNNNAIEQPYSNVPVNAWDKMGLAYAALRPIDHIRPQLLRADAQVGNPTFVDNRATIQNYQSMGRTNNELIQNTSNGQVGRANAAATMGKLFDPINQSNQDMNNQNVTIANAWEQQRNQIMNANTLTNLGALSKYNQENDMYRANLSKEKQMKMADVMNQGHNMTNNMITLGSILEKTPNMTVGNSFWNNIKFKPGASGTDLLTGNNQSSGDDVASLTAEYKRVTGVNPSPEDLEKWYWKKRGKVTTTEQDYQEKGKSRTTQGYV